MNANSATGPIANPMVEGARAAVAIYSRVPRIKLAGALAGNRAIQPSPANIQSRCSVLAYTHAPVPSQHGELQAPERPVP